MTAALDAHLPDARHRARYSVGIDAPPEVVWSALHAVTGRELRLTRALMVLRSLPATLGRGRPGGSFEALIELPFVEAFPPSRGFAILRDERPRVLVAGAAMQPWHRAGTHVSGLDAADFDAFREPGYVRVVMSFEIEPEAGERTRLATETRIEPTSPDAGRRFAAYWLLIRTGSALIRRDILATVARRAIAER